MTTLPTAAELSSWLIEADSIAREAGEVLARGFRSGVSARKKGDIDLVTEFDLASEAVVRRRLAQAFPTHGVVGEEGGGEAAPGLTWFCDPLDGTTNFAHGLFVFAVSIGLALDGRAIAGVVHAPVLGVTWRGALGVGSVRVDAFRGEEPCRVSSGATLRESVIATGFPYDRATDPDNNVREAARIVPKVRAIRRLGSAAIDLCLVADGTYDGYWEQKLAPWDLCAGHAIAEAAGARCTDYEGQPLRIGSSAYATKTLVTNGRVHDELMREIAAARATPFDAAR